MRKILLPLLMASTLISPALLAADFSESIKQAMQSENRSDNEKKRDRNRRPVETLKFFGIKDDMKVLEIVPGGGWYTKLLAPALRDNGQLYLSLGTKRLKESLLNKKPFDKVKLVGSEEYEFKDLDFKVTDLDAVLTFRNYHNFDENERVSTNEAAFNALKPGGKLIIIDHSAVIGSGTKHSQDLHRIDASYVKSELQSKGFTLVKESNLLVNKNDNRMISPFKPEIRRKTDRFIHIFQK